MILYEVPIGGYEIRDKRNVKECPKSYKIFIGYGIYRSVLKKATNKYKIVAQNIYNNYFITYEDAANYCEIKKEEREQRATIMKEEQEYLKNREKVIAKAKVDGAKEFAEKLKIKAHKGAAYDIVTYKYIERDYTITESKLTELLKEYENEQEK